MICHNQWAQIEGEIYQTHKLSKKGHIIDNSWFE